MGIREEGREQYRGLGAKERGIRQEGGGGGEKEGE